MSMRIPLPDLDVDARAWVSLGWALAFSGGAVACSVLLSGWFAGLMLITCLVFSGMFFYVAGLYAAGWTPEDEPPAQPLPFPPGE